MSAPEVVEELPWMDQAACRGADADLWFPERGAHAEAAKATCAACPVRSDCLEYALANTERHGIWGGMTAKERRLELRRRSGLRVVR